MSKVGLLAMLNEIQCDKFMSYGQQRPPIKFKAGLNTVLGGKNANNSIGKSTLLLIVDFCFGGDTYLDNDAIHHVGPHCINFSFKFNGRLYYFSRDTVNKSVVYKCSSDFSRTGEEIDVNSFKEFLKEKYGLSYYKGSFRDAISRYFRVQGKNNHTPQEPLKADAKERNAPAITSLEKLYSSYEVIEKYKEELKKLEEKLKIIRDAKKEDIISTGLITTKKEYNANEKRLNQLHKELKKLTENNNETYINLNVEIADEISSIKVKLNNFMRDRVRLLSQLKLVKDNLSSDYSVHHGPYEELLDFFPDANIKKISEIESFHEKISEILIKEYQLEAERLSGLLENYNLEIKRLESLLTKHGEPANIPTNYLKKFSELNREIDVLENQNADFEKFQEHKERKKEVSDQVKYVEQEELRKIESTINEQMVRFNDEIYERKRKAPVLKLNSGNSYEFYTPDDIGTGTAYKSLIIFDLSVLYTSPLPAVAHDSLIFKNMGDEPVDGVMRLYNTFEKQIFISFDKDTAFSEATREILHHTTILQLDEGGNELFGRSWNIKGAE